MNEVHVEMWNDARESGPVPWEICPNPIGKYEDAKEEVILRTLELIISGDLDVNYHTYLFHDYFDRRQIPVAILNFLWDQNKFSFEEEYHEIIYGTHILAKIHVWYSTFMTPNGRSYKLKVSKQLGQYTCFAVGKENIFDGFIHDESHPLYDNFNETPRCTPTHLWKMEMAVEPDIDIL